MDLNDIDLSSLNRAQKLQLIDLIDEKEKRLRDSRAVYVPNEGQIRVHQSKAEVRVVTAGNGSGKSALGVNEALWACQGFNPILNKFTPVPARVVVVLSHPDKVKSNWDSEIKKWFNLREEQERKNGKPYVCELTFDNGSQLHFFFHEQSEQAFESIEVDVAIFDEPPPRHVWIGLRRGGRKKNRPPRFLFIGTPLCAPWMYTELVEPWENGQFEPGEVEVFQFDTSVNEANLADDYKEKFGRFLTDKEKRVRFGGEFFHLEGLALKHLWNRKVHVITEDAFWEIWDENSPTVISIDPHPNKAHVASILGCDRDDYLYSIASYASREVPREFARSVLEWSSPFRVIDVVCDCLGSTPLTGGEGNQSFIQVCRDEGLQLRPTTFKDKDEEEWIMRIQNALAIPTEKDNFGRQLPKLRVVESNRGMISNIETVSWLKVKNVDLYKPTLDLSNKDYLSTLKYALATGLCSGKLKAQVFKRNRTAETYGIRRKPRHMAHYLRDNYE